MKTVIKIEKADISTNRIGMNVEVQIDSKLSLVFTTEALDELMKDFKEIKEEIQDTTKQIVEGFRTARDFSQLKFDFDETGI